MKIRKKMILSLSIGTFFVLLLLSIFLTLFIRNYLTNMIITDIENIRKATTSIVKASTTTGINNYLRSIAEKSLALCNFFEDKVINNSMTRARAIEEAKLIIKDTDFGKVGETGYVAAFNSEGLATLHPAIEGQNAITHPAIKRAVTQKFGYLEYSWQNPGEDEPRDKASYLLYFEPWDWIIWASSYRSEVLSLFKIEDIRKELLNLQIGQTGYPYVIDLEGTLIVHPSLEGKNLYNTPDADGKMFIQEMIHDEDGEGLMYYRWQNPDDPSPRNKVQIYEKIEGFNWIVAITAYTEDYFKIIEDTLILVFLGIFISMGIIIVLFYFNSSSINKSVLQTKLNILG